MDHAAVAEAAGASCLVPVRPAMRPLPLSLQPHKKARCTCSDRSAPLPSLHTNELITETFPGSTLLPCMQAFDDLGCFCEWPLLPTADGGLAALAPLAESVLIWRDEEWAPDAGTALTKLGLRCLLAAPSSASMHDGHLHALQVAAVLPAQVHAGSMHCL